MHILVLKRVKQNAKWYKSQLKNEIKKKQTNHHTIKQDKTQRKHRSAIIQLFHPSRISRDAGSISGKDS